MKTVFTTIVLIAVLLYFGGFHITLKPFQITMPHYIRVLGWILVSVGVSLILFDSSSSTSSSSYIRGYNQGSKDFSKTFIDGVGEKYYLIEKDSVIVGNPDQEFHEDDFDEDFEELTE